VKNFLQPRSRRWGYDGWAVRVVGGKHPMFHTVCTTRQEARELAAGTMIFGNERLEVIKVKITVEKA